jgi:hypothetical protein
MVLRILALLEALLNLLETIVKPADSLKACAAPKVTQAHLPPPSIMQHLASDEIRPQDEAQDVSLSSAYALI